ncbi:MAG: LacI family DNA-binding transcriptional regulator [Bacteroidota bacterium]
MKERQVTIKDLARKLDISVSTVSRALRSLPDVNPETKKRVIELAEELNYEPNTIALSLVTKRTNTVGVIIPSFIIHFYSAAITGMQEVLSARGINTIICQSAESLENEIRNVNTLLASRVDGIIGSLSIETSSTEHLEKIKRKGIPLILFNRTTGDLHVPTAEVDDYQGAVDAVQHLVDQGFKRIAHIAGPGALNISQMRKNGYLDVLKRSNMPIDEELILPCDFSMESGAECTERLMSLTHPPDAAFVVSDSAAFGAIRYLQDRKLRIPEDLALVGFTNEPLSSLVNPPLTTVSQPSREIGRAAAELFLAQLDQEPEDRTPSHKILKPELVIRESSLKKS